MIVSMRAVGKRARAARTLATAAGVGLVLSLGGAAAAKPQPPSVRTRTAVTQAVSDCRAIADPATRLACYDKAAAALDQAETQGQVVVIDRAQARAVRREAFGFTLPSLSIFTHGPKEEPIDKLTLEIARAYTNSSGRWVLVTTEGAVWEQYESSENPISPRAGGKLSISKGVLGAYFCNVDGQSIGKCRRAS